MKGCQALLFVFSAPSSELFQAAIVATGQWTQGPDWRQELIWPTEGRIKDSTRDARRTMGAAVSNLFHFYGALFRIRFYIW